MDQIRKFQTKREKQVNRNLISKEVKPSPNSASCSSEGHASS